MDYNSFLSANGSLIDQLFGQIKALLQPESVGSEESVPDNEEMMRLRRVVSDLTLVVMPCLELTDQNTFKRLGMLYFWMFIREDSKENRERFQRVALQEVKDYAHWFQEVITQLDLLEKRSPEAAKLFAQLIGRLHQFSNEKLRR